MIWLNIFIFIISASAIAWSGSKLVRSLMRIAKYLGWREFVVAFFVMAVAGSFPNFFIGLSSAFHNIPQLSFGDILGGNMVDLTLAVALAVLIGGVSLPAESKMVQSSAVFTAVIAVLPLILILDGSLTRLDGMILLLAFVVYIVWLFSKSERFKKVYNQSRKEEKEKKIIARFKHFLKDSALIVLSLTLLLLGSEGIVFSAQVFAKALDITIPIVGILIVGLGNALPETYFAVVSARKGQTWMILGDLMGAVIVCATLVLGVVSLIRPIKIADFSPLLIAFAFLALAALFFLLVVRTGQKISKKEGLLLLAIYILFLIIEISFRI
jgi:cation:H+ antiporter